MNNGDLVKEWISLSNYDYKSAAVMLDGKRYLYVAFLCQQAAEKCLKGVFVHEKNESPPRTHNLKALYDALSFHEEGGEETLNLITKLTGFYITSRYGPMVDEITKSFKKRHAEELYKKTGELLKWLKSKLN